ncbi:MAG: hypothetical protein BWK73_40265 [Thiothrix lacustris]|uniref:Trimeric autotransporter adhesin YadA-like C-terminal membrane anchor domain-containing protein n=1 Tax=Thiothrix lacustris TaxID=525917 RepID=A0A1Y1QDH9_9GAMM|nr:MAG: hypothetical protein BWK73_40265 [Thiothrix lacustris]
MLSVDADDGISGNHQSATNSATWTFDENGFNSVYDNALGGGTDSNTTTNDATSSSNTITDSLRTATRSQTATTQTDSIIEGGSANITTRTLGATNSAIVGTNGVTAVMQDDRDFIASTGVGPSSARMGVTRSGGAAAAEVLVTNSAGNTHGLSVGETNTTLSGGTNSTILTLDDSGAKFSGAGGAPARVTGIADGVADFDAVNFRQLNNLDKKLTGKINETGAVAAAFAQLGQAQTPGKSTFGIAAGGQGSKAGVALGFSHRPVTMKPVVIKASLGASGKTVAGGVGATWEF